MTRPYPAHAYSDAPRAGCYWPHTVPHLTHPALRGDMSADVAIVGGGVTGLSAALHLAEAGARVVLLEQRQIGWGASGRSGGFCCLGGAKASDAQLTRMFGPEAARDWHQTEVAAVATAEALIARLGLKVDRHSHGETILAHSSRAWEVLQKDARHVASDYDVQPEVIGRDGLDDAGMTGPFHGAVTIPIGFGLNPLKYATGLAKAAEAAGAQMFAGTEVLALARDPTGWLVETQGGLVRAPNVVIATNGYSSDHLPPWLRARFLPAQSAVLVTRPFSDAEARDQGWTTDQMAYTARTFLQYFRRMPCGRMLFGMRGSLLSAPRADGRAAKRLLQQFRAFFPHFAAEPPPHIWSGLVSLSASLVPFCGPVPGQAGLFAALNYHGNGIAMGSHAGAILADLISESGTRRSYPVFLAHPLPRFPAGRFRRHLLWPGYGWEMLRDQ